jgi:hypothetical protein
MLSRNVRIFILQIWSTLPIQDVNMSPSIYWRWRIISAINIGVVHILGNWSHPIYIGQDSCTAKAKTKADRLHKYEISEPDFNKKGEALQ